jgi:DNA-binding FadR family transcriptional regulator
MICIDQLARQQQLQVPGRLEQMLSERLAIYAALRARDSAGADAVMGVAAVKS